MNKWHKLKERRPPPETPVIVVYRTKDGISAPRIAFWWGSDWQKNWMDAATLDPFPVKNITHWHEIPELPEVT